MSFGRHLKCLSQIFLSCCRWQWKKIWLWRLLPPFHLFIMLPSGNYIWFDFLPGYKFCVILSVVSYIWNSIMLCWKNTINPVLSFCSLHFLVVVVIYVTSRGHQRYIFMIWGHKKAQYCSRFYFGKINKQKHNINAVKWLILINRIQNKVFVYIIYVCVCVCTVYIYYVHKKACIYLRKICNVYILHIFVYEYKYIHANIIIIYAVCMHNMYLYMHNKYTQHTYIM